MTTNSHNKNHHQKRGAGQATRLIGRTIVIAIIALIGIAVVEVAQADAATVTVKGRVAQQGQIRNIKTGLRLAARMHSPRSHCTALVAAMTAESSIWNIPYGHGTSVGLLQLIDDHGSIQWRMKPINSIGWFLRGAQKVDRRRGWIRPSLLAALVQRPLHGESVYFPYVREAARTVILLRPRGACT